MSRRGNSHMKGAGMFVVSLRGVISDYSLALGVLGKTPLYLAVKVSFRIALEISRNIKKLYIFNSFYLLDWLDSCSQSSKWSLSYGSKKGLATPRLVSFMGLIQNFRDKHPRPFHMGVFPPAPGPYVRESKTALDSGFCANDSGLKVLDSGFFVSGTWIPDSLSCNPESKPLEPDPGFPHKQNFPGFLRNQDFLTWGYKDVGKQVSNCICCSLCFELRNDKCKIFCFCLTNWYHRFLSNIVVVTRPNAFSCIILLLSSTASFQAIILIFQLILILTYPSPKPTFALSEN